MSRRSLYIILMILVSIIDIESVEIISSDDYEVRVSYDLDAGSIRFSIRTNIEDVQSMIFDYNITGEATNYQDSRNETTRYAPRRRWDVRERGLELRDEDVASYRITFKMFNSDTLYRSPIESRELSKQSSVFRPIGPGPRGHRRFRTTTPSTEPNEETKTQSGTDDYEEDRDRKPIIWAHPRPPPPPRPESENGLSQTAIIIMSTVIPLIVMSGIVIIVCVLVKKRRGHIGSDGGVIKRVNNVAYDDTTFTERPLPPTSSTNFSQQRDERRLSRSSLYENPGIYDGSVYDEISQNCMYEELPSHTSKRAGRTLSANIRMSERPLPGVNTMECEQSDYIDPDRTEYNETYGFTATPDTMYEHPQPPDTERETYEKLSKQDSLVSIY